METNRLAEVRDFVRTVDPDLQRTFDFHVEEVRDSGAGGGIYTIKGHAAVYNKWSLDLGGFRERIKPGAFDNALSANPHVMHLWDHDTSRSLASTRSKDYPLELRSDPQGLRFYSKVAPTSYAADLRVLLEGGVIDQSSFAFTVKADEWRIREIDGQEIVERTIGEVDQLFDVTTCAMGAYPTTDSALAVRSISMGRRTSGTQNQASATTSLPFAAASTGGTAAVSSSPVVWVNGTRMVGEPPKEAAPAERASGRQLAVHETRADMETLPLLMQMYELGQEFIADETDDTDAADVAAMNNILTGIERLVEAEANEPNEPDEPPMGGAMEMDSLAHKKWQSERALAYRRTREFAFGVNTNNERDSS